MKKFVDLTGRTFSELTVVKRGEDYNIPSTGYTAVRWECLCSCGNISLVGSYHLNKGKVKSCGRCDENNLIGVRFGHQVVIKSLGKAKNGRLTFEVLCDCGSKRAANAHSLKSGESESCNSCASIEKHAKRVKDNADSIHYYRVLKQSALKRDIELNITETEAVSIGSMDCFYCGATPPVYKGVLNARLAMAKFNGHDVGRRILEKKRLNLHGIDRIDSTLGYEWGNIRSCCKACNIAKASYSSRAFLQQCKRVVKHLGDKAAS